jgi:phosphatidylserine/phosphatidylglycerophosphate/cardiolipin synthase-like enzyme
MELEGIAAALRGGRIAVPVSSSTLARYVPHSRSIGVAEEISRFFLNGASTNVVADMLDLLASSRASQPALAQLAQLVTTGPEERGEENRDTQVVVQDLFRRAKRSVVIAGYKVNNGRSMFEILGEKLRDVPGFSVTMLLDIQWTKTRRSDQEALQGFRTDFVRYNWPEGAPLPSVYYDPRSLGPKEDVESVLHAKCVIVDGEILFVSSANFTGSAQLRNIELGVLLHSADLAGQAERFFEGLVGTGHCVGLFGRAPTR